MIPYKILKQFRYDHLPPRLRLISKPFSALAWKMAEELPRCEETEVGLRKLLEAKDCAVRAEVEAMENEKQAAMAEGA